MHAHPLRQTSPLTPDVRRLYPHSPAAANQCTQKPSTFFVDEWRTPTYVSDLVASCRAAVELCDQLPAAASERIFNVGGPERVNRVDMALALCKVGTSLFPT